MKKIISILSLVLIIGQAQAQTERQIAAAEKPQVVEASCGQCKFGMTSKKGCDLAIRIKDTPYFVTGTSIDKHGDAHADDGFCNSIRKAEVTGAIVDNKFVATSFKLLPEEKAKP
jgi:hypothetical protein